MGLGVSPETFAKKYPRLYHMASLGSWSSIQKYGLLSTEALLDVYGITGEERHGILARHRSECIAITHPAHGTAIIRDQKPMDDRGIQRALQGTGLKPSDWYQKLNQYVFFWPTQKRLEKMLTAKAYRAERHTVLTIDTRGLLRSHSERILLSPLNSGCTKPFAHPRGSDTFRRMEEYPFESRRKRGLDPVAEILVEHSVPDIVDHVLEVHEMGASRSPNCIFLADKR